MQGRLIAAVALALLNIASVPALAASDGNYLQNALDGGGRCLGTAGPSVAMMDCDRSPTQQWLATPDDVRSYLTSSSSTSKIKFEFGGIGPAPCSP
jgi:hypothetical protein